MVFFRAIIIILFAFYVYAQQTATLSNGDKIQVFNDGTWKPFSDSSIVNVAQPFDSSCEALILHEEDKMTGKKFAIAKEPIIVSKNDDKALVISLQTPYLKSDNNIIMAIKVFGGGGCIDENEKIQILFHDGSRMELRTDNKFNCDAKATVYFGGVFGKKAELRELLQKKISAMRVWTRNSYVEENFSDDNSKIFLYTLRCLTSQ